MKKISIVLPSYNGEKYIRESIQSVIDQTYPCWELIIVDDCSSDGTLEIAKEYEKKDVRIHVYHNETNQKLPESLNIGFRKATGKYLTWTSDDNVFYPMALERMAGYLDLHQEMPMVCTDMHTLDLETGTRATVVQFDINKMYFYNVIGACFLYRRCVLEDVGEYNASMFCAEDYEYWLRIMECYGTIGHIDEILYLYRYHSHSLTRTRQKEVQKKTGKILWTRRWWIWEKLKADPEKIVWFFYLMKRYGYEEEGFTDEVLKIVPCIKKDKLSQNTNRWILYGAGCIGTRARAYLDGEAVFYVDGDESKVGQKKDGLKIISVDELCALQNDYRIMISLGMDKYYEVMKQFEKIGICEFCTYLTYIDTLGLNYMNEG